VRFTTDYVNNSDYLVKFGGHVEARPDPAVPGQVLGPEEHANLFLFFYPADSRRDAIYTTTDAHEADATTAREP
jgi:hypothetical protein